jgi:hypothetical protein
LVEEYDLPRGTLFRIFPVDMETDRLGDDDHAYSFDWEAGKQYWFDIIHDPERDSHPVVQMRQQSAHIWKQEEIIVTDGSCYKSMDSHSRLDPHLQVPIVFLQEPKEPVKLISCLCGHGTAFYKQEEAPQKYLLRARSAAYSGPHH